MAPLKATLVNLSPHSADQSSSQERLQPSPGHAYGPVAATPDILLWYTNAVNPCRYYFVGVVRAGSGNQRPQS